MVPPSGWGRSGAHLAAGRCCGPRGRGPTAGGDGILAVGGKGRSSGREAPASRAGPRPPGRVPGPDSTLPALRSIPRLHLPPGAGCGRDCRILSSSRVPCGARARDVGPQRGPGHAGGGGHRRRGRWLRRSRICCHQFHVGPDQLLSGPPGGEE